MMACRHNVISYQEAEGYKLVCQTKGPTLGYTSAPILVLDGYAFKDLNCDGTLDAYEDWRLPAGERAADLASRLTLEEICGLMLYSSAVDANAPELSEEQKHLLENDHIRHINYTNGTANVNNYKPEPDGEFDPTPEYPEGHYNPISLQWGPYTANIARQPAFGGGNSRPSGKSGI